jgi:hypothetical protein
MFHLCKTVRVLCSYEVDFETEDPRRVEAVFWLFCLVLFLCFASVGEIRRQYPDSLWAPVHSRILLMVYHCLTVAVGSFVLCIQKRTAMWVMTDVIVSVVGLAYGSICLQKELRNTGGKGVVLHSNAVPIFWTGVSALFVLVLEVR